MRLKHLSFTVNDVNKGWSFTSESTQLSQVTFCVVDLETTGSSSAYGGITEIGAVKYKGGEEVSRLSTLVNPGQSIPANIVMLTGISDSMVADAPRIEDVLETFLDFVEGTVLVAHNARFDVGFLNAALQRHGYDVLSNVVVDTVTLARRLVRSEVPNCKLSTLASHFNFPHQPIHRAMDDVLATGDLLHLLIDRASGFGVHDLEDFIELPKVSSHPEASKLKMTDGIPRTPGVYLFLDASGEILYVGKATNLRQRVRSYFSSGESRRKVGSLLKLVQGIQYIETPDPLTAEVWESRIIGRVRPRYNHMGTRTEKYCYVRLTTEEEWPRLVVAKTPTSKGVSLGPIRSRSMARDIIDAIESVVPLRRCTVRMTKNYSAPQDAPVCSAARLGLAYCPCSGTAEPAEYEQVVNLVRDTLLQTSHEVIDRLNGKMASHSQAQRFEEAAQVRDRLLALETVQERHRLATKLRSHPQLVVKSEGVSYNIASGVLISTEVDGQVYTSHEAVVGSAKVIRTASPKHDIRDFIQVPTEIEEDGQILNSVADEMMCLSRLLKTSQD